MQIESIGVERLEPGQLNQSQLQALVMSMADTLMAGMKQAAIELEIRAHDSRERLWVHGLKYAVCSAAVSIANGPSPEAALLDILTLARMQTVSLERRLARSKAGETEMFMLEGEQFIETSRRLEELLWREADLALTDEQQDQLRLLIDTWLDERPEAVNIYFIRLNAFVELRDTATAEAAKGLLAEVGNATRAVDQARLLGERAMWYAARAPILLGYQVEMTTYELLDQPEIRRALDNYDTLTTSVRDIATGVQAVPVVLDEQRTAWLDELEAREGALSEILAELRVTVEAAHRVVNSVNETVQSVDGVVARFDTQERQEQEREPLDFAKVRDTAVEAGVAADEFTELLNSVQGLLASPDWEVRSSQIGQAWGAVEQGGRSWISLTFRQGLYLIAAWLLALIIYKWISVKLLKA